MRWDIEDKVRAQIVGFSGINFSGERWEVEIWPFGGRQGDEIDGRRLKSIGMIAPIGVRLVLITAASVEGWEELPWRCIQVIPGHTFDSMDGKRVGVQVPDLDRMDPPHVRRIMDPDTAALYPDATGLDDGKGWTFGRSGGIELKGNIRAIKIEKFDPATAL